MIANRRREHTVTLEAGVPGMLVGRDLTGRGGHEGVLNGGRRARLNLTNGSPKTSTSTSSPARPPRPHPSPSG
ncbi:MAG: hypothetical protein U0325_31555 [Polyangiales bacterium]